MKKFDQASTSLRTAISLALTGAGLMLPVHMALAQDATDQESQELEEVVVTGFRGSLNTALGQKREATAAIDSIVAEDIGKFPDSNLAESMQRIPGVTLSRTDGGEGRNISVRGLGPTLHPRAHQRHGRRRRKPDRATSTAPAITGAASTSTSSRQKSSPRSRSARPRRRMSRKVPWVQRSIFGPRVRSTTWTKMSSRSRAAVSTTRFPKTSIRARRCSLRKSSSTTHSACSSRPPIRKGSFARWAIRPSTFFRPIPTPTT